MSDLIRRADALAYPIRIDHYDKEHGNIHFVLGIESVMEYIENLPSAELVLQTPQTYGKSINPSNAEVVADYISREDALTALNGVCSNWQDDSQVADIIKGLPSVKPTGDLISRADAIQETRTCDVLVAFNKEDDNEDVAEKVIDYTRRQIADALSELPSAEAVSREELTETKKNYIDEISGLLDKIDALSADAVTHGRLIDADALSEKLCATTIFIKDGEAFQRMINDAPTVSAEAVQGYTEWLEKIIVNSESFEWLCEDTTDEEWCEKNCKYDSIQAECLRHLYGTNKSVSAEAVQGEWIERKDCEGKARTITCSRCGYKERSWVNMNFCPNCGARMYKGGDSK